MYFYVSTLTTARCLGHTRPWHRVGPSRSGTVAEEPVPRVTQNYSWADELSQIISSYLQIKEIFEGLL